MWIFLPDAFLSIGQHEDEPKLLQVRARFRGDIERMFPEAFVAEDLLGDYRFCAAISRERVAHVIALRLTHIEYISLEDRVAEAERGLAYDKAYGALLEEQVRLYAQELDLPGVVPKYDLQADPEAVPIAHRAPLDPALDA